MQTINSKGRHLTNRRRLTQEVWIVLIKQILRLLKVLLQKAADFLAAEAKAQPIAALLAVKSW
jgi:hypothetical protein